MILVVGGIASGKRTFARSLGFAEAECAFDIHELARDVENETDFVEALLGKSVVTCAEVGSGIVPLDAGERAWRERVGRVQGLLAQHADVVVRMVCGIPVVLKGNLEDCASNSADEAAPTVELVLIRHGRTPGNDERRYVGVVDQPLSEKGREQAQAAEHHDDVARVYVSKLRRTHETAAIMFPNAEQVVVEDIHEMDFGTFAGRSAAEMSDDPEYRAWVDSECTAQCPGGEAQGAFTDRVCAALEELVRQAAARGERQLVVVAHGGTMMAFLSRYGNDPSKKYWDWLVGNCEGYRIGLSCKPDGISAVSVARW